MSLFRRRRAEPPEWAGFLGADEWEAFVDLVRPEAERRGWSHDLEAGTMREPGPEGAGMGLGTLAQMFHAAEPGDRGDLVRRHFELLGQLGDATPFAGPDEARAAIKARLVDDGFLAEVPWEVAGRRVADDLQLVLAFDLPTTVSMPQREQILEWGTEDELFDLALEHARAEPGLERQRHELPAPQGPPTPLWALVGDSFFTATHVLWADELDPPPSEHGTIVAVPHRHTVLAHPIRDLGVVGAVTQLIPLVHSMWIEGPGSISESLYWLRDGALERLDVRSEDDRMVFTPSDALLGVLNSLE
jgi:hypothetical protein